MNSIALPLADELAIKRLTAIYASAIDRRDYQAFAACFLEHARWSGPSGVRTGHAEIIAKARSAVDHLGGTQHMMSNFIISLDGDDAQMESYFQAVHIGTGRHGGQLYVIGGRYQDVLRRTADGWKFAERKICPIWSTGDADILVDTRSR